METRYLSDPGHVAHMDTAELRRMFLIESLFAAGQLQLLYCDADRAVVGSAVPLQHPLALSADGQLRAEYFNQCRELGVMNIGGEGTVKVDGQPYVMQGLDCLYVGRGSQSVVFASRDAQSPAQFYLVSFPAHVTYPTVLAERGSATALPQGTSAACNQRTIYKYIHSEGIRSCQLVMGVTKLAGGSVWNTMPAHIHERRTEVYLYFDLDTDARVFHMMGTAAETRPLVVADRQAVISPPWSMHSGVGTTHYSFCWAMGGENQTFADMELIPMDVLR